MVRALSNVRQGPFLDSLNDALRADRNLINLQSESAFLLPDFLFVLLHLADRTRELGERISRNVEAVTGSTGVRSPTPDRCRRSIDQPTLPSLLGRVTSTSTRRRQRGITHRKICNFTVEAKPVSCEWILLGIKR